MKRTLELDKNLDKYVLFIENESPIENAEKLVVGTQTNTIRQVWDKEHIGLIRTQVEEQKQQNENKLKQIDAELKTLPKFTDREKQQLTEFKEKLQNVQALNKMEQLAEAKKNHEDALVKINKDLEELDNAIKSE